MTYPDVSGLPVNVDTTYADSGTDASVKIHQQNHDLVHDALQKTPAKIRAEVEAELVAGTNVTITPAGTGATRTLTIASTSSGGGGGGSGLPVLTRSGYWQPSAYHLDGIPSGQSWPIINRIYFTPHYIPAGTAITAVALNVTEAGAAGVVVRFAVFTDNGGVPGTLVEQGTVAASTTGAKTLTLASPYTSPGVFWIACGPQGSGTPGGFWGGPVLGLPTGDNGASWGAVYGSSPLRFDTASALSSSPAVSVDAGTPNRFPYTVVRVQ